MSELPPGWEQTKIGEIARIETGNTPPKSNREYYAREVCFYKPGDLDPGGVVSQSEDMVSKAGAAASRLLPSHTLLVTCIGNLGKSALTASPSICNQQINAVLPTTAAEPRYLYYWSRTIRAWLEENSSATTVSIINKRRFSEAPIKLAPLPEQRRIVAKIDSLSAKSKRARDHLDHIPRLVEKYKQAILAAAFHGELTPTVMNWHQCTISEACDLIDGDRGPNYPKREEYLATGYCLFLSTKNVRPFGFDFSDCQFLSEEKHKKLRKGTLSRGDVVITTRGTIGNVAHYGPDIPYDVVRINSGMLIIRPHREINSAYLSWYVRSPLFVAEIERQRTGSAQPQLPARTIKRFPIRFPALLEQQHVIVRTIEAGFAWIDRLASEATSARTLIDHLDQAVLAKAFRGELVPQDPTDEPASKLLECIQAERSSRSAGISTSRSRRRARKITPEETVERSPTS
jgi:type I restriction enzyme S subunit